MEQVKITTSRLFVTTTVENKDDVEEKLERSYKFVQNIITGLGDKDTHDALNNALQKEKGYEDVSLGLLVTILSEPTSASKSFRDLTLITRDGFILVLNHLSQLVLERYLKLNDVSKSQLLWLLREMIRSAVTNVDNLCWNLLRHAAGGDVSPKNLALADTLLDVFIENRNWLDKFPVLIASVVYTYLRLIEDHHAVNLADLRRKEVQFLVKIIRERFCDCLAIGRDFVRLLQNVARIPEFEQLWRDILTAPKTLSANFSGVLQLLQTRTSRRFLQSRLTPEMERKLVFLTSQVRFGNHKRYQDWFQRQYLATPESQSLRCDMIRFIVGVIHPTNELLSSDIIPRWAVIGWLLTTCTSSVAVSNAKLALFYDWLFFESDKDNIMNIEPAILVMHHSMRSHPAVSATLLDFLCRIITNFYPPLTEKVRNGIHSSLKQILDKRVLPSLLPLFDNAKLDRDLKTMIRETFKEFCVPQAIESSSKMDDFGAPKLEDSDLDRGFTNSYLDDPAFSDEEEEPTLTIDTTHTHEDDTDDDDIPLAKVRLKKVLDKSDDSILEGPIKLSLTKLQNEKDPEKKCQLMDCIVNHILDIDEDTDIIPALSKSLSTILEDDLKSVVFPKVISDESLQESISSAPFVLFKTLYSLTKQDSTGRTLLLKLLAEMHGNQSTIGYLLLYFLKVQIRTDASSNSSTSSKSNQTTAKTNTLKVNLYKDFCQHLEKKIDNCLYDDLTTCHVNATELMLWLVPDLYRDFKQQTVNNAQILRVILSSIDAAQLQDLVGKVMRGRVVFFRGDSLQSVLKTSLSWESVEQLFLWQLVRAHDIAIECIVPLVSHLDYSAHAEALTAITLLLKRVKPTGEMVKYLFSRDVREVGDPLVYTLVKYWCESYTDKVAELVAGLLSTRYPATSPNKRKRHHHGSHHTTKTTTNNNNNNNTTTTTTSSITHSNTNTLTAAAVPSADQVLGHLDHLRRGDSWSSTSSYTTHCHNNTTSNSASNSSTCGNSVPLLSFYGEQVMQRALHLAAQNSSDSQRKQFSGLFALSGDEEEGGGGGRGESEGKGVGGAGGKSGGGSKSGRGRKPALKAAATTTSKRNAREVVTESSEESSEEEEIVKARQPKKRKKVVSDSD